MGRLGVVFGLAMALAACGDDGAAVHGASYDGGAPGPPARDAAAGDDAIRPVGPLVFPDALGAHWDTTGRAIRFRVYSAHATRIELSLYGAARGEAARARRTLARGVGDVWSVDVGADELQSAGIAGAVLYGYRAWGPNFDWDATWTPGSLAGRVADVDAAGNRFDPNKLLVDPYAREISHDPYTGDPVDPKAYSAGAVDSGPVAPKSIVLPDVMPDFGQKPARALADDVVYEVHVRGLTNADPSVPADARGTFRGAAAKAAYLKDLGVTAIELLPIQETQNDANDAAAAQMTTNGMNYWGYSTIAYFAPDRRYSSDKSPGGPTRELVAMVKAFHDAGLKVFLDVVYNHTAEGTSRYYSHRGLDNAVYYELTADGQGYADATGTGASVNTASPAVRGMVMDSLAYFANAIGVDGFRFDLAPVLGNACASACFRFDAGDPENVLNRAVKELPARPISGGGGVDLIAEPWAISTGGYQLGNFPAGWSEWNGSFRDTVRRAQNELGVTPMAPAQIAARVGGSDDLFGARGPSASIDYVASHDGFTLRDVYSYAKKNNAQPWPYGPSPGGDDANDSWDQGGDSAKQHAAARAGFTLAMTSLGVPMITGGDEMFRTQYGNNNAYDLDSDKNWLDWSNSTVEAPFLAYARAVLRFRGAHAALRAKARPAQKDGNGDGVPALAFLDPTGAEASAAWLADSGHHFLAWRLDGTELGDASASIWVAYNADATTVDAHVPAARAGRAWFVAGESATGSFALPGDETPLGSLARTLAARDVLVLIEK